MTIANVTSTGQITIPASVRKAPLETGDRVEFVEIEPGEFLFLAANRSVTELKGIFGRPIKIVSIDDMDRALASRRVSVR